MEKFNHLLEQKKGEKGIDSKISVLIGAVILIVLVTALAPEIFTSLAALDPATGTPAWVKSVLIVIVGAGLVFLVWRTFGK